MFQSLLFCVACLHFSTVTGSPRPDQDGVGAYAYQDSNGNRYGGTFNLKDGEIGGPIHSVFPDIPQSNFIPEYFKNLESQLQEAFNDINNQHLAYTAATKAFDITSNQAGFIPNFDFRFPNIGEGHNFLNNYQGQQGFPSDFQLQQGFQNRYQGQQDFPSGFQGQNNNPSMSRPNTAFAQGAVGPGYSSHVAGISPQNPDFRAFADPHFTFTPNFDGFTDQGHQFSWHHVPSHHDIFSSELAQRNVPNVNVMHRVKNQHSPGEPHVFEVKSKAYASSSNVDGKEVNQRGSYSYVNNDGKVSEYHVHN